MSEQSPSEQWQAAVGGVWHGLPACYTPEGRHIGFIEAHRAVLRDGDTLSLRVATTLHEFTDESWAARLRFPGGVETFTVHNDGPRRLYLGPDCHGIGQPFGGCTLGVDHQRPWSAENHVIVLLHPSGDTQTYSNVLRRALRCELVLHGLYLRTGVDWSDDPEQRERVAQHLARERAAALEPVPGPAFERWTGELELHGADQRPRGRCGLTLERTPARSSVALTGALALRWHAGRVRRGLDLDHIGPDAHGSGLELGRARYDTLFLAATGLRLEAFEYAVAPDERSVCWQLHRGLVLEHVLHGRLVRER